MYKIIFFLILSFISFASYASEGCHDDNNQINIEKNIEHNKNHKETESEKHDCNILNCECPKCTHCTVLNFSINHHKNHTYNPNNYFITNYFYSIKEFLPELKNPPPIYSFLI